MNERLIDLYKEACEFAYNVCETEGRKGGPSDHIWSTLSTGRFAELIIQECATVTLDHRSDDYYQGWLDYRDEIRQHFGVES